MKNFLLVLSVVFAGSVFADISEIESELSYCLSEPGKCEIFYTNPDPFDKGDMDPVRDELRLRDEFGDNPDYRAEPNERSRDAREKAERDTAEAVVVIIIDKAKDYAKKKIGL